MAWVKGKSVTSQIGVGALAPSLREWLCNIGDVMFAMSVVKVQQNKTVGRGMLFLRKHRRV